MGCRASSTRLRFTILLQSGHVSEAGRKLLSVEMNTLSASPVSDPLLASTALPHRGEFYPLGFPVLVASNTRRVLEAAGESWGRSGKRFDERPVEIRCLVSKSAARDIPPDPVVRAQGSLLVSVADAQNFACCDMVDGSAAAWVTDATAADFQYFRYHFLEAMAYCLLDTLHLVAVHAACVSLDGHGVLLAGDSGAGKSSLAYACARRGWVYTSDDSSSVLRRGDGRTVLGNSRLFRFRESAGELFPEFRGLTNIRRANGKPTIEVTTDSLPGFRTAPDSQVEHVVFLNRREGGRAALVPLSAQEAWRRIFFDPWPPDLPMRAARHAAMKRLLGVPAYEMRYRDLDDAANRLEQLVRGGSQ